MPPIIEIRSYKLKPDKQDTLHQIVCDVVRPMLKAHGTDVVAAGPSGDSENAYYLIRAYRDIAERDHDQQTFYGGSAWRDGPRESVLACIENYATIVLDADETTIDGLRDLASPTLRT